MRCSIRRRGGQPAVLAYALAVTRGCWRVGGTHGLFDPAYSLAGSISPLPVEPGVDHAGIRAEVAKMDTAIQKLPACSSPRRYWLQPNGTVLDQLVPVTGIEVVLRGDN